MSFGDLRKNVGNRASKAQDRAKLFAANVGSLKNAACQAEQVRLNTRAIAAIGRELVKQFPSKDGGLFKKSVRGYQHMAANADCKAIKKEITNKSMFANYSEQANKGGKRRKSRKRKKSRRRKNKSRRRRKKSRRKRKRRR